MNRSSRLAAAAVLAVILSGCATSSESGAPSGAGSPAVSTPKTTEAPGQDGATIAIKDFAYTMATAAPGSTVTVKNTDSAPHTVTADDGTGATFDVEIAGGKTATFSAPDKAGTYAYHCNFHPNMKGTLQVSG
ncbi:MAG: cupredoxin domain-containing protein [Actinomycetota bacterium]|nr:cupredoxin domain-containing protein [Actinomycetota bacterium]